MIWMKLISAFVSGMNAVATIRSFEEGSTFVGYMNLIMMLYNGFWAIYL